MTFSRNIPVLDRTFALRAFNAHETEINRHYWSFEAISNYSGFLARTESKRSPLTPTAEVFHASGPDAGRIPTTVADWLAAQGNLENWLRLSAVVSASSYLETYMRQVVRSALMSAPLCRHGAGQAFDGITLLKLGKELPFEDEIKSVTRRDWTSRTTALKKLFGSVPLELTANIARLERIRSLRNNFAHGFGRSLDVPQPTNFSGGHSDKLSAKVFLTDLGAMSKVAASLDKLLLSKFIGNFELLYFYHNWRSKVRTGREATYSERRALQRAFQQKANCSLSAPICSALIAFYGKA